MGDLEIWDSILKLKDRVAALEKGGPVVPVPVVRDFKDGDFVELVEAAPGGGPLVGSIGVVVESSVGGPRHARVRWARWSEGWSIGGDKRGNCWIVPIECLKRA